MRRSSSIWCLSVSVPGQSALVAESYGYSVRPDVAPPQGGVPLAGLKLLWPEDWETFHATQRDFVRAWNRITGLR